MEPWEAWAIVSSGLAVLTVVLAYLYQRERKRRRKTETTKRQHNLELRLLKSTDEAEREANEDRATTNRGRVRAFLESIGRRRDPD